MFAFLTGPHGRQGWSALRPLRTLAAVVGLAVPAGLLAADPSVPSVAPMPPTSDVRLASAAMAALDADPYLRDVTLIVSVVDRVAVVGGAVPTPELGKRAEDLVRQVPGIGEVRNRCFVNTKPDPLLRAVSDRLSASARKPLVPDLPSVLPGVKVPVSDPAATAPDAGYARTDTSPRPVTALKPAGDTAGILMGPLGATNVNRPPVPPVVNPGIPTAGMLTATPNAIPVVTVFPRDIVAAADVVRKGDPRYTGLKVELQDGMIVVSGTVKQARDAWDLAQAVRKIPGAPRVVIGDVVVR